MRNIVPAVCIVAASAAFPSSAGAQISDFSFFEEALEPHGDWLALERYGPVWRPAVDENWAPYTVGNWAYTDSGWTWISHEPFGNIVFHYGRWLLTDVGWCWVPGSDWGPAWVSWRVSGEHIGWAPLPPEAVWHPKHGITYWVDVHTEIGPAYYRFCGVRDFCAPVVSTVLFRPSRNLKVMLETHNVTNIVDTGRGVFCGGPQYRWVQEVSAFEVPVLRLVREENFRNYYGLRVGGEYGPAMGFVFEDMLVLPGPRRVDLSESYRTRRGQPVTVSFSRGWYGDTSANERLRSHYDREWEARQSGQTRGMAVLGAKSPEVRIQVVTSQEKQVAFAGVVNRGSSPSSNVTVPGFVNHHGRHPSQGSSLTPQPPANPGGAPAPTSGPGASSGLIFTRRSGNSPLSSSSSSAPSPQPVQKVLPVTPSFPTPSLATPRVSTPVVQSPGASGSRSSGVFSDGNLPGATTGGMNSSGGVSVPAVPPSGPNSQPSTRALPPAQVSERAPEVQQSVTGAAGASPFPPQNVPAKKRTNPVPQMQPSGISNGAQQTTIVIGGPSQTSPFNPQALPQPVPQSQPLAPQPFSGGAGSVPSTQRRPASQSQIQPVQPSSAAQFTITPAPAPAPVSRPAPLGMVPQVASQPAPQPQPQPLARGAQPAPAPAAAPASSGASISTVPAGPAPGQVPVKKKKPGDPGYVPPPQ